MCNTQGVPTQFTYSGQGDLQVDENSEHGRTPLIRINCDGEPSGYAENPDN